MHYPGGYNDDIVFFNDVFSGVYSVETFAALCQSDLKFVVPVHGKAGYFLGIGHVVEDVYKRQQ